VPDHLISLEWACLRRFTQPIGFVNVAWGGGVHAFPREFDVEACGFEPTDAGLIALR
jgi:hypothetical protein